MTSEMVTHTHPKVTEVLIFWSNLAPKIVVVSGIIIIILVIIGLILRRRLREDKSVTSVTNKDLVTHVTDVTHPTHRRS